MLRLESHTLPENQVAVSESSAETTLRGASGQTLDEARHEFQVRHHQELVRQRPKLKLKRMLAHGGLVFGLFVPVVLALGYVGVSLFLFTGPWGSLVTILLLAGSVAIAYGAFRLTWACLEMCQELPVRQRELEREIAVAAARIQDDNAGKAE